MRISVIIPCLNEAEHIQTTLKSLQNVRESGEIIVVDGGSQDDTLSLAQPLVDRVIICEPGRARQMNAGALASHGSILWFVHADTSVPESAAGEIVSSLRGEKTVWGRFDIQLSGKHVFFRVIERFVNWRSRVTGISTGDQCIFIKKNIFEQLGGFVDIPLMEDIELCKRLNTLSKPVCLKSHVLTSSRRWESKGIVRTVFLMWRLRVSFALGASPAKLARLYPQ